MSTHVCIGILSVLLLASAAGCGGDDGAAESCTPGLTDMLRCPQMGTECAAQGNFAMATCGANGTWGGCDCKSCGNGRVDSQWGEECEPGLPIDDCLAMGMGTGLVTCTADCKYNTTMCTMPGPPGGMGGGGTGGGF